MYIDKLFLLQVLASVRKDGPPRILIDVDAGIDDAQAISLFLAAESNKLLTIEAITFVNGNTNVENVGKNVVRILETAGRLDIPVFYGDHRPFIAKDTYDYFYGLDGFGDIDIYVKEPDVSYISEEHAITAMYRIVKENPGEITIIALAPLTNLATAEVMYSDFMENIKEIYIMGGNFGEDLVEFNFKGDPEAANIVLESTKVKTTLYTWQACVQPDVDLKWRFNHKFSNALWYLLDTAEQYQYDETPLDSQYISCDCSTALVFLHPKELIGAEESHCARVVLEGENRGMVYITDEEEHCEEKLINFITVFNTQNYKTLFAKDFSEVCNNLNCENLYLP